MKRQRKRRTPSARRRVGDSARANIFSRAVLYVGAIVVCFVLASTVVSFRQSRFSAVPDPDAGIIARVMNYQINSSNYDVVFIGDSRTYCAVHPDLLDPMIGKRSVNLSAFSHWLPTQYAELRAITDSIPRHATVVWLIGASNFTAASIYPVFPLAIGDALELMRLGFSPTEVAENLLWSVRPLSLWPMRVTARNTMFSLFDRAVYGQSGPAAEVSAAGHVVEQAGRDRQGEVDRLRREYGGKPNVVSTDVLLRDGRVTSVAQIRKGGSYYRIEIDPTFFRAKQKPDGEAAPDVSRRYWNLFIEILDVMKQRGVRLAVLPIEDAPYVYGTRRGTENIRQFMNGPVRAEVEKRGFNWLAIDFDEFDNSDYFDNNHLNSKGIDKFLPQLARALRPLLTAPWVSHAVQ